MPTQAHEPIEALYLISLLDIAIKEDTGLFAQSIKLAIAQQQPCESIIYMIADQALDNPSKMDGMFGPELIQRILKY